MLVNSKKPYSEEAKATAEELQKKYQIPAMPVNCEQLKEEDICHIMETVLYAFPVCEVRFLFPNGWRCFQEMIGSNRIC